jgi:hypothetical protein
MNDRTSGPSGPSESDDNVSSRAAEIGEQTMAELDRLREQASVIGDRVVAFIRERPGTSLLIAAGAGYLIGRIARS